ncbi:hypothetical protein K0M31_000007 [Melipona bicolor]|uniref:Uncharacterized protein n=1 Tax=Melipona bicolor TaxID=60889 RepID=A0AA40KW85_9HYME|nr:hypothetical protein K0M31_000007 [Melipona bicolor]
MPIEPIARSKSAFESCNMHAVDTRPRGVHNLKHGERSPHGCPAARIRFCGQLIQALVAQLETDRMCRLLTRNSDNRGKLQRNWNVQGKFGIDVIRLHASRRSICRDTIRTRSTVSPATRRHLVAGSTAALGFNTG